MKRIIGISGRIWKVYSTVAIVFMFGSVVIIIANVVMRRFFNAPIFGSTEIIRYLGLSTACFAIVENEWSDGNITLTLLLDMMPKKMREIFMAVGFAVAACALVLLDFLLVRELIKKYVNGDFSSELMFPLWIPSLFLTLGVITLTIVVALKAAICMWCAKTGETVVFARLRTD